MIEPVIRPARPDDYDAVARVWMESWVSTGFGTASELMLTQLRTRVPAEVANGWSLYVADHDGRRMGVACRQRRHDRAIDDA